LYELRGRQNGHDREDWLLAEQELRQHYLAGSRSACRRIGAHPAHRF
jgi:hypothetical protein